MLEKDKIILRKIIKYCDKINNFLNEMHNDREIYICKEIYQLSTDMCIFQIGELSIHVSEEFKIKHLEIPWAKMKGMRNIHAHEYDNINRGQMWHTLLEDIPKLKDKINKILDS